MSEASLIVSYVRESSPGQADEDRFGLPVQRDEIAALAASMGMMIQTEYFDIGKGELWYERENLQRLVDDMRQGKIKAVFFHALDRIARHPGLQGRFLQDALFFNVEVFCVHDKIDMSDDGQMLGYIRGSMAKRELDLIRRRTQAGRKKRAESGKPIISTKAPYGYQYVDKGKTRFEEHPVHGPIMRRIFAELLAGTTLGKVADGLTADGILSPKGKVRWRFDTISRLAADEKYIGRGKAWRGTIDLPTGVYPPLVSEADFYAIRERLQENKLRSARNLSKQRGDTLLRGFMRCGHCGQVMVLKRRGGRPHFYQCKTTRFDVFDCPSASIAISRIEQPVWEKVTHFMRQPEVLLGELERMRGENPAARDLEMVERSMKDLTKQRDNLAIRLALVDDSVAPIIADRLNNLQGDITRLESEQATLKARLVEWQVSKDDGEAILRWCRAMSQSLDDLDIEARRMLLTALGVKIKVYKRGTEGPRFTISGAVPLDESTPRTVDLQSTGTCLK